MSWQEKLKEENRQWKRYARELKLRLDVATDRLSTIATGMHYSDEITATWTTDTKARVTASEGLKKIIKMPQRPEPL